MILAFALAVPPRGRPGLFVAQVVGESMNRRIPNGYTVKVYESAKAPDGEGGWRHVAIRLKPDTDAPGYQPIVLRPTDEGKVQVIAEVAEVLPGIGGSR